MDSITHTVLGACLGQVLAGKKIGKKAMLWGAVANNIPDIDIITSTWMSQADGLMHIEGSRIPFYLHLSFRRCLRFFLPVGIKKRQ